MPIHLYLMSAIYVVAGIFHFIKPKMYKSIIPRYLPYPMQLVYLSGIAEVALGVGVLFDATKNLALWGIILMLIAFFPVHVYMLADKKFHKKFPKWLLWLRLPMQFGLMYWAYSYI